jgi:pimeloyl-ACP methyl ester carboxylesterase
MSIDPVSHLYFESSGPETAPSIVFLHGGGVGGWMWRSVVKNLQSDFHCLVPDLPEQGHNILAGDGAYTTEGAADRIAAFIRSQAHGAKASVVGLSEGAQVVVALLSRQPEVIEHAISSSAVLRPLAGNRFYTPGVFRWSYRLFMGPFKKVDWWIRVNMHGSAGISDEYFEDFKQDFQWMTEDSLAHLMSASLNFRLPAGLEKARLPVLVVVGSKEYEAMKKSGLDLLKALPDARGVMVDLGPRSTLAKEHNWALTDPDFFAATVRAFVTGGPLPAELLPLA